MIILPNRKNAPNSGRVKRKNPATINMKLVSGKIVLNIMLNNMKQIDAVRLIGELIRG